MPKKVFFKKDWQYFKFCSYGFLKNLRFFEPFLMVFLLQKLPENYTQIGFLYSLRFIIRMILEIPSGIIADALGRKGSMIFSYSLYIASFVLYYLANSFYQLLVPSVLFGIADAFRTGTHKAMILEYLARKGWGEAKTTYYGLTRSWSQTGSAASSLIVFLIFLVKPEYDFLFLITTLPYIIGLILLATYPSYLNLSPEIKSVNYKKRIKVSVRDNLNILSKSGNLMKLSGTSLYFGYFHTIKDYIQPIVLTIVLIVPGFIESENINTSKLLPLIYFSFYLVSTIASRNAGKIRKKFRSDLNAIIILALMGGVTGILIAVLHYMQFTVLVILLFITLYSIINMQRPSVVSYVSTQFDKKNMAAVLSVESQLGSLIAAILSFVCGYLANNFNIAVAIGSISVFLALFSFIIFISNNT